MISTKLSVSAVNYRLSGYLVAACKVLGRARARVGHVAVVGRLPVCDPSGTMALGDGKVLGIRCFLSCRMVSGLYYFQLVCSRSLLSSGTYHWDVKLLDNSVRH